MPAPTASEVDHQRNNLGIYKDSQGVLRVGGEAMSDMMRDPPIADVIAWLWKHDPRLVVQAIYQAHDLSSTNKVIN